MTASLAPCRLPGKMVPAGTKRTRWPGPSKPGQSLEGPLHRIRRHLNRFTNCSGSTALAQRTGLQTMGGSSEPGAAGFATPQDDHPLSAPVLQGHRARPVQHPLGSPPASTCECSRSSRTRGGDRHGRPHPRRTAAHPPRTIANNPRNRHQSPARDPTRNAFHSSLGNARIGPKGSFESRTSTAAPVMATSTQLPVPLAVLFFHRRGPCW